MCHEMWKLTSITHGKRFLGGSPYANHFGEQKYICYEIND